MQSKSVLPSVFVLLTGLQLGAQIKNQSDDGQWTMPAKNFASTRFSTLTEINTANVKNLKLDWTFSTGLTKGHEAAPLVVNSTMYVVTPWPNLLYALDLTKPGGRLNGLTRRILPPARKEWHAAMW